MATVKSTDESFDQLVKDNKILICDFWAEWCGPCHMVCLLYTSPSPRDGTKSRMPSSA